MIKNLLALLFVLLMPNVAFAAISANTVWEIRGATGADTNGGGFVAGASGTDYSQQAAAQYALTNGVTNATTTVATVSAATDMVGNIAYITGGTGSVAAGWYQITAASAGVSITVDRSTGLTAGTGVTINVGGALATVVTVAPLVVNANKTFVKNDGTYNMTVTANFSNTGNIGGTAVAQLTSYTTTRGDGGRATLKSSTNTGFALLTMTHSLWVNGLILDCNSLTGDFAINNTAGSVSFITGNKIQNCNGGNIVNGSTSFPFIINNEITGGASSTSIAIQVAGQAYMSGNYIHDGQGIVVNNTGGGNSIFQSNIVSNMSGTGAAISSGNGCLIVNNNIFYNSGGDAVKFNIACMARNNIFDSNAGYGLDATTASAASYLYDGNAYYNNTLGTRHNIDDTSSTDGNSAGPYTNVFDVTLTSDPFVSAGSNFALNTTAGGGAAARGTGVPNSWLGLGATTGHNSFGPVQPNQTSIVGGAYSFGQ